MKKIALGLVLVLLFGTACYIEHNYTRKDCEVVRVENGIVRFEDKCGFYWDWEIEEDEYFEVGDFDSCSSGYVGDDVITKVIFHD